MTQQTAMTKPVIVLSVAITIGLLAVLTGVPVGATQVDGVRFEERFEVGSDSLARMGTGILRYMGFIKAYAGALYTLPGTDPGAVLEDSPKRLEVEYFVALKLIVRKPSSTLPTAAMPMPSRLKAAATGWEGTFSPAESCPPTT